MQKIHQLFDQDFGVSPVIGVILMVAVTVAVVSLVSVIVFNITSNPNDTGDASVLITETSEGIDITLLRSENADSVIVEGNYDSTILRDPGDSESLVGGGRYTVIVETDSGEREVIRKLDSDSRFGLETFPDVSDSEVLSVSEDFDTVDRVVSISDSGTEQNLDDADYSVDSNADEVDLSSDSGSKYEAGDDIDVIYDKGPTGTTTKDITGNVKVNPAIQGADVIAYQNGSIVDQTITDPSGDFTLSVPESKDTRVVANVENADVSVPQIPNKFYAGASKNLSSGNSVSFNFDESQTYNATVNNTAVTVGYSLESTSKNYISNLHQLQVVAGQSEVRNNSGGVTLDLELVRDIDASATDNWNDGDGFIPIGTYSAMYFGDFDGKNHTVSDLYINQSSDNINGLFGYIGGNKVENLNVYNADVKGGPRTGVIAGLAEFSEIRNVSATGQLNATGGGAGGVVGYTISSTDIYDSNADVVVNGTNNVGGFVGSADGNIVRSYSEGSTKGDTHVGGLVGNLKAEIFNSYSKSSVTGNKNVGALVGGTNQRTQINNSYGTGSISGSTNLGGIVGGVGSKGITINGSYWDTGKTGVSNAVGNGPNTKNNVKGLTTSEMTGSSAKTDMSEFDFTNIWVEVSGKTPEIR